MPSPGRSSHTGIVQSIDGGEAVIAVAVQGCASCGQQKNCGIGKFAGSGKLTLVRLPVEAGLKAGDQVTLSVGQGDLNRAALLGYLLPALLLVCGAVAGQQLSGQDSGHDGGAALGALAGLAFGVLLGRLLPRLTGKASAPLTIEPDR